MWQLIFSVCILDPNTNSCLENNILKEELYQKEIKLETEAYSKAGCYVQAQSLLAKWVSQQGVEWHIVNWKCGEQ